MDMRVVICKQYGDRVEYRYTTSYRPHVACSISNICCGSCHPRLVRAINGGDDGTQILHLEDGMKLSTRECVSNTPPMIVLSARLDGHIL